MKLKNILGLAVCLVGTGVFASCDDFFDLNPKDQLTTNTFWNTSEDVDAAVTAAYNWWVNNYVGSKFIFYEDSYSDIGFNYTNASNMRNMQHLKETWRLLLLEMRWQLLPFCKVYL